MPRLNRIPTSPTTPTAPDPTATPARAARRTGLHHFVVRGLLVACLAAGLVACSDDNDTVGTATDASNSTTSAAASGPAFGGDGCTAADLSDTTDLGTKPKVTIPDCQPPTELEQADLVPGRGDAVAAGDNVTVKYVGVAWSNGKQFDASWDRGDDFTFGLGQSQVITGWDQGVEGMKAGGRRVLVIPPDLGYGEQGAGADIKPGETLVFVVDLVKFTKPVPCAVTAIAVSDDTTKKPTISFDPCTSATDLASADVVAGNGAEATAGKKVTVQYVGVSAATGQEFDASWERGEPFSFTLGAGQVIQGWDQGVEGMKVGTRRVLLIPADLAYGPAGSPPAIAPNATLIFVVDLLKVEDAA